MRVENKIYVFLTVLLLFSCKKELNRPTWEVDVSVPVIFSSMGIENLIPDSLLSSDSNGEVSLVFNQSVFKLNLDTLLNLPDTTVADTFSIPPPFPSVSINPGQTIITNTENKRFDLDEIELTSVKIRSGETSFFISSTISQPTVYEYTITNAIKNGSPFHFIINVPAGSQTNPSIVTGIYDFDGYELDLRGDTGNEYNKYKTIIKVSLATTASVTTVYSTDKVIVKNTFSNLRPAFAEGYFGSQEIEVPYEETVFNFLQNLSGTLDLDQVDIDFEIINGIGIDATAKIDTLKSVNTRNNNEVLLNHSFIGNSININRATNTGSASIPSSYLINLNNGNSNTDVFLENLPDKIGTSMGIFINPMGNISGHHDFLYDDKTFDVRVKAEIPLNIIANNLTLCDTLELNINNENTDNVNKGVLHVFADNGFPLSTELQLYLLDNSGNIIDSIVNPNVIFSAYTNSSHIVTASRETRLDINLNQSQIEHLLNTNRILIKTTFNTSSLTQHVQIYNHYRIGIRITTELNYTVE
jgi:hypothetical protein